MVPNTCIPCTVANCRFCQVDENICDIGGCYTNFILNSNVCSCPTTSFMLDATLIPNQCRPCADQNCLNCSMDMNICESNGCRHNFLLSSNNCICPTNDGYRLDTLASPNTCQPCTVANCRSCFLGVNQCDPTGCYPNFRLNSNVCSCPVTEGFFLDTIPTIPTCLPCLVQYCYRC